MGTLLPQEELIAYREFAIQLAQESGKIMMKQYRDMQEVTSSSIKTDLKIKLDKELDLFIRKQIGQRFPDDQINSEELDVEEGISEYQWIVDPLDGTIGYTRGLGHFGTAIGVAKNNKPVLGIFYAPKDDELYVGQDGNGALLNTKEIHVGEVTELSKAYIALDYGKIDRDAHVPYIAKLLRTDGVGYPVTLASAATALCMVADGRLDAYIALKLESWDMAAAAVILREAGAKVTTIEGNEWKLGDESIVAANAVLHEKLLNLLQ